DDDAMAVDGGEGESGSYSGDSYSGAQDRVAKYLATMLKSNRDFTDSIKKKQEFGNPAVLTKICQHYGVDDRGSNYPRALFDAHGYDMADYYDNIAAEARKRQREAQQQQQQQ
ncbi:HCNGP-like protein-domain-containing protein, partial [Tribonema minus]